MARGVRRASIRDGKPSSVGSLGERWFDVLRARGFSESTVRNREVAVARFHQWCDARGVDHVAQVNRQMLDQYQRWLFHFRKENGTPISFRVQYNHLVGLKQFFRWLTREGQLALNPASELELPKLPKSLPRAVLSVEEVERVMGRPDVEKPLGLRDRAILEVLYSTGMRRTELVNLRLYDVDAGRGTVLIRQGKGKRDRFTPVGERALMWMSRYTEEVRPTLAFPPDDGTVFLGPTGKLNAMYMSELVRKYVDDAQLGKTGSCHLFRHTAATLMLEGGADIRFIQAFLGHADLGTTQVYTRVSIGKLKEIHNATHPGAQLLRAELDAELDEEAAEEEEERD